MSSEQVALWVAVALVAWGATSTLAPRLGFTTPPPVAPCAEPRLIASDGIVSEVGCGAEDSQPLRGAAALLFGIPLDLNRAAIEDLVVLPGVGPARAEAIVAARGAAPFCEVGDLERVRGIGPRTVEGVAGWVRAECDGDGRPL